jgi:large subunit ribosomal protein L21
MYAIIDAGGRQVRVEQGQELEVDYRDLTPGQEIQFERVYAYRGEEGGLRIGQPTLATAKVTAQVLGAAQGPKLVVQKMRRRKNFRRKTGHRAILTRVKITKIEVA